MTGLAGAAGVLVLALVFDRMIGDPAWLWRRLPHPVALAGRLVDAADRRFNRTEHSEGLRRVSGALTLVGLATAAVLLGAGLQQLFALVWWAAILEAALVSVLLAHRSLLDHVGAVASALAAGDLGAARTAVGHIVGRDVAALQEAGISRAAIESLAENFSDGLVAPALWYLVAGLPGLMVYKLVNTADSMIGHKTPRHAAFGCAAARTDDLMNLVPARVSALLIAGAALARGRRSAAVALAVAWREAPRHRSPNAGWPEAAVAGGLDIRLGGPRAYGAAAVDGTVLNEAGRTEATAGDIGAATRLADIAWIILLVAVGAIALAGFWLA